MLDNLREQSSFQEESEPLKPPKKTRQPRVRKPSRSLDEITHMTAAQRFTVSIMLLVIVILLGAMLLVISGKMVPSLIF